MCVATTSDGDEWLNGMAVADHIICIDGFNNAFVDRVSERATGAMSIGELEFGIQYNIRISLLP